jgi:hypothetical protein
MMAEPEGRKRAIETGLSKPARMIVKGDAIPNALRMVPCWVNWQWVRKQNWTKMPINPRTNHPARTNDPGTWGTYDEAWDRYTLHGRSSDGLGFVFDPGNEILGLDLDDCRHPDSGELTQWARTILELLPTYTEVSPSGTGVKLFGFGRLPDGCRHKVGPVEVYDRKRFFTVTGHHLPHTPAFMEQLDGQLIVALMQELKLEQTPAKAKGAPENPPVVPPAPVVAVPDVVPGQMVMPPEVRRPAPTRMLKLWAGDWSGYPSQSEADLALLGFLSRSAPDAATLDRWFRLSGLMRPKWDEPHAGDGRTYGQMTVRMTVQNGCSPAALVQRVAQEVAEEPVEWLWPGFIAFGNLTVLDGDPGLGKSTLTLDLAARLTRGRGVPGHPPVPPAAVLLACCEDSASHTLVPRLRVAEANLAQVFLLEETREQHGGARPLQLPDDLLLIQREVERRQARLLVIDPLMAFLGRDRHGRLISAHQDQSVRMLMGEFKRMAEQTGAAVLVVRHLNKAQGLNALYRGGGSIGISGAARSVLLAAKHPDDPARRVLASIKCNLGPMPHPRAWRLTGTEVAGVDWGDTVQLQADELTGPALSAELTPATWLADQLSDGQPHAVKDLQLAAEPLHFSPKQLQRARQRLGARVTQHGQEYYWQLPG